MSWLFYAIVSAVAAAATAILAKIGVEGIPSSLATALRTCVVVVFAWMVAALAGEVRSIDSIPRRSLIFLALSGIGTGVSWLAYFRALQLGPASRVAPIDKMSLPLTVLLAAVLLAEKVRWTVIAGVALMTIGALMTVL